MSVVGVLHLQQAPSVPILQSTLAQIQAQQPLLRAQILLENGRLSLDIRYLNTDIGDATANQIAVSCVNLLQQIQ